MDDKKEKMINSKYLALIIVLIGVIVLIPIVLNSNKDKELDNENDSPSEIIDDVNSSLDDVKSEMTDLYGGEGKIVEVKEDNSKYVITVTNSNNNRVLNIYEMDKETRVIEEVSLGDSSSASNG